MPVTDSYDEEKTVEYEETDFLNIDTRVTLRFSDTCFNFGLRVLEHSLLNFQQSSTHGQNVEWLLQLLNEKLLLNSFIADEAVSVLVFPSRDSFIALAEESEIKALRGCSSSSYSSLVTKHIDRKMQWLLENVQWDLYVLAEELGSFFIIFFECDLHHDMKRQSKSDV